MYKDQLWSYITSEYILENRKVEKCYREIVTDALQYKACSKCYHNVAKCGKVCYANGTAHLVDEITVIQSSDLYE